VKVLQILFRMGLILVVSFTVSFSSAVIFFNFSEYESVTDRAFLVIVPALAIAYLLFGIVSPFWNWLRQRQFNILFTFAVLAIVGASVFVLPYAISRIYFLGLAAFALALFALMLPVVPSVERIQMDHSIWHYAFGFLLCLLIVYGVDGFLTDVLQSTFNMIIFTFISLLIGSVFGYYLVQRVVHSFNDGFLSKTLNIILCLTLPLLLSGLIYASLQFPSMFVLEYIKVPSGWFGLFTASALTAGVWGIGALEQFESRDYYRRFKQTKLFKFISENLAGIYAGGMFFLINLVIARALNHPALNINTVLFESDAGPWMTILGSPEGDAVNRSVHPLVLITVRPLIRFASIFMADQWNLAAMIVVSAMSGLCVLMAWIFVKRATGEGTYAFIFAILLGSTATHLFFGSLTDTYIFGMTSLIFFYLLIQAKENRFSVLVPAGLLVFGITITNIVQGVIGLFFNNFGIRRLMCFCVYVLTAGICLTVFASVVYPNRQTFFFVPSDIAFERNFVKSSNEAPSEHILERIQLVSRVMFLYGVTGPRPIEIIANKPPRPTIDLKTFDLPNHIYASYKGFANIPLVLWLILLAGSFLFFVKGFRFSPHVPLMLGLLGSLAFNFLLHMIYGTELFLYSPYWIYLLLFFVALAYAEFAGNKWFESILMVFVLMQMINNAWFIFVILRGLAPFYAAT
jgi:hypothetical protein